MLVFAGLSACSSKKETPALPKSGLGKVDSLVSVGQFSAALSVLSIEGQREDRVHADVHARYNAILAAVKADSTSADGILLDAHLAYASWLEYFGVDTKNPASMKEVMPAALQHYRRVLQLDPFNEKAKSEISQIESIYKSMNRDVPQGVAE